MYALIILVVMVWLSTIVESQTIQNTELTSEYQNQTQGNQVRMLAENVRQFYQETHTFPVSISSLVQTPGFEHNRSQVNNWQNYAVSSPITDPSWQFKRAVLFSRKPTDGLSLTAYLSSNSCGTGSFNAAAGWCGMNTSYWWRYEDRELYVKDRKSVV